MKAKTKSSNPPPVANALNRVRKYFPNVNKVVDAAVPVTIAVIKKDSRIGKKKDPANCALARACVRTGLADGAIINIGTSYLIKGDLATRYSTGVAVGREITSFDRHQDFATGKDYRLSAVCPSNKLGTKRPPGPMTRPKKGTSAPVVVHKHHTTRIRVAKEN